MKKNTSLFILSAALLFGSFFGTYFRNHPLADQGTVLTNAAKAADSAVVTKEDLGAQADALSKEVMADPKNVSAIFLAARIDQRRGFIDKAIASYEQMLPEAVSQSWAAHFNVAELYETKGNLDAAERHYRGCVELAPNQTMGWLSLIRNLEKQKKHSDAVEFFNSLQIIAPDAVEVKNLKAEFGY